MEQTSRALVVAAWAAFAAAAWLAGATTGAAAGHAVLGAEVAKTVVLGIPVVFYAAAAGVLLQLLRSRTEGVLKLFQVPEGMRPRYRLNPPDI